MLWYILDSHNSFPKTQESSLLPSVFEALTFTTLWVNSADGELIILFLFFPENGIWHFMQIVSIGDNLHEISKPVFWEKKKETICMKYQILFSGKNKKNISKWCLLKNLPRVLSVKYLICYWQKYKWRYPGNATFMKQNPTKTPKEGEMRNKSWQNNHHIWNQQCTEKNYKRRTVFNQFYSLKNSPLTHLCQMNSTTLTLWTGPFPV